MADIFCYHGGSNTSPYETWAKAATAFATAVTQEAAGDDIFLATDHSEAPTTITYAFSGTNAAKSRVISTERAGSTYSRASAAQIAQTGANDTTITGWVKFYGVYFRVGDDFIITAASTSYQFEDSTIEATGSGSTVNIGTSGVTNHVTFNGVDVDLSSASGGNGFSISTAALFSWIGGTLSFGGTPLPATLFSTPTRASNIDIRDVDLSSLTTIIFSTSSTTAPLVGKISNCKLGVGVALYNSIGRPGTEVTMFGCDDATGNDLYRMQRATYYGDVTQDDATYRDSGASDGTTNISWKMVSNANAIEYSESLISGWISGWVNSTGSTTFTIEMLSDNVTYQDDEIWIEIELLDDSASTQGAIFNDRMATILSTPANQATSTEAWTEALGTPVKQKLSTTQTVNRVGPFRARVHLAKASSTAYVDPKVELS